MSSMRACIMMLESSSSSLNVISSACSSFPLKPLRFSFVFFIRFLISSTISLCFSNLNLKFKLEKQSEIVEDIRNLIKKTNENLKGFNGKDEHALEITFNEEELDSSIIIQALIDDISGLENGVGRGLDDLGQGTQRIIIASILKAYVDILIERNIHIENPILILFEEPEI